MTPSIDSAVTPPAAVGALDVEAPSAATSLEQFRSLALRLLKIEPKEAHRVVMVTSALKGEGKTLTVTNLALTLAGPLRKRVLLIDGDLRRPAVRGLLNPRSVQDAGRFAGRVGPTPETLGMTLGQVSDMLYIYTLEDEPLPTDPVGVLSGDRFRALLDWARSEFSWVLIDTPPALIPDTNIIGPLCDGVLFVVASGVTPFEAARRAIDNVGRERVLGVVMNRVPEHGPDTALQYYQNAYTYRDR